jgi:alpha-tubulin suppressor-like RCC1 family protein
MAVRLLLCVTLIACGTVSEPVRDAAPCNGSCVGEQTCATETDTCVCPAFFEVTTGAVSGCRIQPLAQFAGATDPSGIYGNGCLVTQDQGVRCWGYGGEQRNGVVNTGNLMDELDEEPSRIALDGRALAVEVGTGHSCALLDDGRIQCWGPGFQGQLGDGMAVSEPNANLNRAPVVTLAQSIAQVATGGSHTCVRLSDGTVSCWGGGGSGETGANDTAPRTLPTRAVPGIEGVIDLDLGFGHSCAIVADGAVRCWGEGTSGQLGVGMDNLMDAPNEDASTVPLPAPARRLAAGGRATCAILEGGAVHCWGSSTITGAAANAPDPVAIPLAAAALRVAISDSIGAALLSDGRVQLWGNAFVVDGRPATAGVLDVRDLDLGGARPTHLAVGAFQLCVTFDTDRMTCWGESFKGEFGTPVTSSAAQRDFAPITTDLPR